MNVFVVFKAHKFHEVRLAIHMSKISENITHTSNAIRGKQGTLVTVHQVFGFPADVPDIRKY